MSKWGKRIKEARIAFGISAVDAAAELGVSLCTLKYHESGKTCPTYDLRVMIDDYYGIPCERCTGVMKFSTEWGYNSCGDGFESVEKDAHCELISCFRPVDYWFVLPKSEYRIRLHFSKTEVPGAVESMVSYGYATGHVIDLFRENSVREGDKIWWWVEVWTPGSDGEWE